MKIPTKFPHRIPELAAWRGVIYKSNSRGHDYFKLVYRNGENGDGRKTLGFDSIADTLAGAQDLLRTLSQADGDSIILKGNRALEYRQAIELAGDIPLNLAIGEFIGIKKIVGESPLRDVGQFYAQRRGLNLPQRTVAEVVTEMLKAKRADKLSPRYIKDLENRLERFGGDCTGQLADLTAPTVSAWLRGLSLSPRSQNNFRTSIETLCTFAKSCGYLPRDWNELDSVPRAKDRGGKIEIFTPTEVSKLLSHAPEKLLPFVVIAAFSGMRSAEIERLTWQKVNLKTGYITIDASIAKTNSRRVVPIQPNLRKWLLPHYQKQGKVCPFGNVTNQLVKLSATSGVDWKQNALRHGYASYRLASTQDAARVSLEMGNSPQMIFQHYRELVTPEQAATYFSIAPAKRSKVLELKAA